MIRPPFDEWFDNRGQLTELEAPPIGLAIIAKAIKAIDPSADVHITDGLYSPVDNIIGQLSGNVVGVSVFYSNHLNGLRILREAKRRGAVTFIGGPNVSYLAENILRNHDYVDYVVVGDGEESLSLYCSGERIEDIPNIVYRKNNEIRRNRFRNVPLKTLFDLEEMDGYKLNTANAFPLSSIRGCIKAETRGRCSFCSINHSLTLMEPKLVWKQIRIINDKYGAEYFWETGDSFIVGDYPKRLLDSRPKDLSHIQLKMYTIPDQLNEQNVEILSKLNVKGLFIGIDSVNEEIIKNAGKSYTREQVENALRLVKDYGISIHVPFILGLPGTTHESLEENFEFVRYISNMFSDLTLLITLAVIFPGTRLFNEIRSNPQARAEYIGDMDRDDFFDYKRLFELNLKYFSSVEPDTVYGHYEKALKQFDRKGRISSFALNKHEFDNIDYP